MAKNQIELYPTYWASFSGGKDSLYMIYYILNHLDKYPLTGVVYFDLETDFPFIKNVVDYVESELKRYGVPMLRIKPRKSWHEMYYHVVSSGKRVGKITGYPTRLIRWCSNQYKADSQEQLTRMMREQGKRVIYYIGFCADEVKRFKFELNDRSNNVTQIYPLAEAGINESEILEWAKNEPIYNDYYKYNDRCGCICCPMASLKSLAYTKKYYPEEYEHYMKLALETEKMRERELGRPFSVWASNPKYNTEYRMRRVDELIAKEEENEH